MHIVNQNCLRCGDCVQVCPVRECFKIGEKMVVIDPNLCIDCGLCAQICPNNAIVHDSVANLHWITYNARFSKEWDSADSFVFEQKSDQKNSNKGDKNG